jgi:hypothetical protein
MKQNKTLLIIIALFLNLLCFGQEKTITGTVKTNAETLPGASVVVKNKHRGVATDMDGKFSIKVKEGDTLIFSYVGCEQYILAILKEQATNFIIQLKQWPEIIADYGPPIPRSKKENLSQSISKISKAELRKIKKQEKKIHNADSCFIGKTYKAQIGISCKEKFDGGCTIYSYCVLKFDKDSVAVSHPVKAYCTPDSTNKMYEQRNNIFKKYKWHAKEKQFVIEGFDAHKYYAFEEVKENNENAEFTNDSLIEEKAMLQNKLINTFSLYKKELEVLKKNDFTIQPTTDKPCKTIFYKYYGEYHLNQYDEKNFKFKQSILKPDNSIDIVENVDSLFDKYESYYSNGIIKSQSISSWLGFTIGTSYKYNKKGKVVEAINWNQGYVFSFNEVLHFLHKKNIPLTKSTMTKVYKITNNNIKTWVIIYEDNNIKKVVTYILDASNGNTLNRLEENLPVFIHGLKLKEP